MAYNIGYLIGYFLSYSFCCTLPVIIIRYLIWRKPLQFNSAVFTTIIFLVFHLIGASNSSNGMSFFCAFFASACNFYILTKE